jgi:hypothetical protein
MAKRFAQVKKQMLGSRQDTLNTSYSRLEKAFGKPLAEDDPYKVAFSWVIRDKKKQTYINIYDYKQVSDPSSEASKDYLKERSSVAWSVGAENTSDVDLNALREFINQENSV